MHFLSLSILLIFFIPSIYADTQNTSAASPTMPAEQVERVATKQLAIEKENPEVEKSSSLLNASSKLSQQPGQIQAQEKTTPIPLSEKNTERTDSTKNLQQQLDQLTLDIRKINAPINSTVDQGVSLQFRESIRILDKDIIVDNNLLAALIALLSLLVALFAFIFALRAKSNAIKTAKKSAETHFFIWLEEKESEIVDRLQQKTEALHNHTMTKALTLLDERLFIAKKSATELGHLSDLYQSLTAQYENDIRFSLTQFDQSSDPDDVKKFAINLNNRLMHREKVDYSATDNFDQAIVSFHQKDYLSAIAFLDQVINNPQSSDLLLANALFNKAYTLQKSQRTTEAITTYDEIILRVSADDPIELQNQLIKSFFQKGFLLEQLDQMEQAITVYDQIIARFSDATDLFFEVQINRALIHKAVALSETDATDQALTIYDDLVSRLEQRSELELQQIMAQALVNKSHYLDEIGQQKQAIAGYESVVALFADSADLKLQTLVTQSMGHMLAIFDRQEKPLAVIELCDKIHLRFARSNELLFKQLVARALEDKAMVLLKFNKAKDAVKIFDEIIARFGKSRSPSLKTKVNDALTSAALVSVLCEELETTKIRIQRAEKVNLESSLDFVVMAFVRFLIDATTVEKLVENADKLAPDTKFDRSFAILKNFIKRLPLVKQIQANAMIDFFETHHDINKLKKLITH
ncbi:MAG: tetratricopeptide (TPR) repeat protein [Psychromonas sp.]|jgi:tetratricopeptide (TPR) repeat protein